MNMGYEHEIRERAYALWVQSGMIDGEAERHWLHAEAALRTETSQPRAAASPTKPAIKVAAKPAAKTSAAKVARSVGARSASPRKARAAALEASA